VIIFQSTSFSVSPMGRMGEHAGGLLDYFIVLVAIVVVIISTTLMVARLIRPGEDAPDHIKRSILDDPYPAAPTTDRRSSP
jgi:hypothetical protein